MYRIWLILVISAKIGNTIIASPLIVGSLVAN